MRLIIVLVGILAFWSVTFAQDAIAIEYGEVVEGEITDDEYEIPYTFTGSAGDVVLIEMRRGEDSDLFGANLILLDTEEDILADATRYFSFEGATSIVAADLPEDGTYTVLATRDDGRSGDDVGEFTLKVIKLEELSEDLIESQVDNDTLDQHYVIRATGAMTIDFNVTDANERPVLLISRISGDGYPETIARLTGESVISNTLTVDADDEDVLIVSVILDEFVYRFNDNVEIEYELSVIPAE